MIVEKLIENLNRVQHQHGYGISVKLRTDEDLEAILFVRYDEEEGLVVIASNLTEE